jgi:imidazolonepropionase-like amidohydrolase
LKKIIIDMKVCVSLIAVLLTTVLFGQSGQRILLLNGYLHVGNGETMASAMIGIEAGEIKLIRNSLASSYEASEWDTIIDLKGGHIYPGFVAPNNTLGLTEIDAVRATLDFDEVGSFNPHIRAQIAYNVESTVISTVRSNGILITQSTPRGGIISGSSAVMRMDGWNWEDATIVGEDGIHLNWPRTLLNYRQRKDKSDFHDEEYVNRKREIYAFFEMAKAYATTAQSREELFDGRFEAMRDCFKGDKRVYVHANELAQILDIIEFARHFDLKFPVIVGGYDAHLAGRKLADSKIPVMLQRLHSLPEHEDDPIDLPFALPALLKAQDIAFCLQNEGDMEAMNARNLPFLAGTAQTYGLTEEEAVSALSLWPCQIMGIDKRYGSVEQGKSATLFVSTGDALDMRSNHVFLAMIDGKFVDLRNHQSELYEKYRRKYATQE